ncbi:dynein regulatory complex subunit 4-like [Odontesthes bonariensis]|uniref:dynein regulatory complex subunit 4-like n=1 Tax=Odontesthes bonariensis TaxID=219752 RepID=UPI003F585859
MSKDQLEEHIVRLREELDREREERSYFQLERDKLQAFWEISKRNLEESEAELRNRSRQREEAEERHRVEISVYKQKLKHVLSEQHNTVSELKMDGVSSSSLVQNQHTESELALHRDVQGLQAERREKKLHNEGCVKELKLKHQVELMELNNHYDRRFRDVEVKNHQKMQSLIEAEEKRRRTAVGELESQMKSRVASLTADHDRALRGAEEYFSTAQNKLQEQLKELKEELGQVQKQEARVSKQLSAARQENTLLTEELCALQQKLPEMQRRLQEHEQNKDSVAKHRAHVKVVEKELRDLTVEHELLLQAFQQVQQERDELLRRQRESILDVQQRSGLKRMLLERKLAALTETLEKKEAQLCAALSVSSIDPTARSNAANKLEELLESKRVAIDALQEELDRECKDYEQLLHSCKERLQDSGVPLHDFLFRPAKQILEAATAKH